MIEAIDFRGAEDAPSRFTEPLLAFHGVVKRWRRDQPPVLAGIELEARCGSVVAISGRNGSGKTTLLRIASGLLLPDRGTVRVCGLPHDRKRSEINQRIGFLLAGNASLYARLTPEQHLDLWARLALLPPSRRRDAIASTVQRFQLDELSGTRVDRLSMGQRQRVRLAMTFLHDPELVLLDEPYTSLDAEGLAMLRAAVRSLCERGGSAVICAPNVEPEAVAHDLAYVLEHGELVKVG